MDVPGGYKTILGLDLSQYIFLMWIKYNWDRFTIHILCQIHDSVCSRDERCDNSRIISYLKVVICFV